MTADNAPGPGKGNDDGGNGKGNDTLTRDLIAYARATGAPDAAAALTVAEDAIKAAGRSSYFACIEWIDTHL